MKSSTIAIDIDDVLADYAEGFIEFSNHHWGTHLTIDDYDEHWAKVWKVEIAEVIKRAAFTHESGLVATLSPKLEAKPVLEELAQRYNLIVVTSRRIVNKADTLAWLKLYYPMLSEDVVTFSGFYDQLTDNSIHQTKGSILASLGVTYMIDDQPKHCLSAIEHGIEAILFGDYAWNRTVDVPDSVTRIKDWESVRQYFHGR